MRCLILFFLIFHGISFSQNFTLSGYLEDIETGESLIGANILIDEINIGGSTNNYGFFSAQADFLQKLPASVSRMETAVRPAHPRNC